MSAFYNDVSKDRLYTLAARSRERRSAQSAMYIMADGLTRLMAPILSFTADELWRFLPGAREESVHIGVFPSGVALVPLHDRDLLERWETLIDVRSQVLAEIEPLRKNKQIGSSLQAKVVLSATSAELALLEQYERQLPMLFIVSEVELRPAPAEGGAEQTHHPALGRVETGRAALEAAGEAPALERGVEHQCEVCMAQMPVSSSAQNSSSCRWKRQKPKGPAATLRPKTKRFISGSAIC